MLVDNASELRDCEAVAKTLGDRCGHTALCWRPARLVRVLRNDARGDDAPVASSAYPAVEAVLTFVFVLVLPVLLAPGLFAACGLSSWPTADVRSPVCFCCGCSAGECSLC